MSKSSFIGRKTQNPLVKKEIVHIGVKWLIGLKTYYAEIGCHIGNIGLYGLRCIN